MRTNGRANCFPPKPGWTKRYNRPATQCGGTEALIRGGKPAAAIGETFGKMEQINLRPAGVLRVGTEPGPAVER